MRLSKVLACVVICLSGIAGCSDDSSDSGSKPSTDETEQDYQFTVDNCQSKCRDRWCTGQSSEKCPSYCRSIMTCLTSRCKAQADALLACMNPKCEASGRSPGSGSCSTQQNAYDKCFTTYQGPSSGEILGLWGFRCTP